VKNHSKSYKINKIQNWSIFFFLKLSWKIFFALFNDTNGKMCVTVYSTTSEKIMLKGLIIIRIHNIGLFNGEKKNRILNNIHTCFTLIYFYKGTRAHMFILLIYIYFILFYFFKENVKEKLFNETSTLNVLSMPGGQFFLLFVFN
jgi:hypothetical protein